MSDELELGWRLDAEAKSAQSVARRIRDLAAKYQGDRDRDALAASDPVFGGLATAAARASALGGDLDHALDLLEARAQAPKMTDEQVKGVLRDVRKYANHTSNCELQLCAGPHTPCTCGLELVMQRVDEVLR